MATQYLLGYHAPQVVFHLHILRNRNDHAIRLDVLHRAEQSAGGDHLVTGFQGIDALLHFLALALLRANQQEVEHQKRQQANAVGDAIEQ